jgi:hypothetical protein
MSVTPFALEGFEMKPFTSSSGRRRNIYRSGAGPAVVVIHEMPVTLPYVLSSLARACVNREFTLLALNKTSPIVDYLRELAAHEHHECGGPGVGALDF